MNEEQITVFIVHQSSSSDLCHEDEQEENHV